MKLERIHVYTMQQREEVFSDFQMYHLGFKKLLIHDSILGNAGMTTSVMITAIARTAVIGRVQARNMMKDAMISPFLIETDGLDPGEINRVMNPGSVGKSKSRIIDPCFQYIMEIMLIFSP